MRPRARVHRLNLSRGLANFREELCWISKQYGSRRMDTMPVALWQGSLSPNYCRQNENWKSHLLTSPPAIPPHPHFEGWDREPPMRLSLILHISKPGTLGHSGEIRNPSRCCRLISIYMFSLSVSLKISFFSNLDHTHLTITLVLLSITPQIISIIFNLPSWNVKYHQIH